VFVGALAAGLKAPPFQNKNNSYFQNKDNFYFQNKDNFYLN